MQQKHQEINYNGILEEYSTEYPQTWEAGAAQEWRGQKPEEQSRGDKVKTIQVA